MDYEGEFDRIWEHYPRKVARKQALKKYVATRRRGVGAKALERAVKNYAEERDGEDHKFTMHGATFFGPSERWRDYEYDAEQPALPEHYRTVY